MHSGAAAITLTDVSSDVVRVVSSDGAELTAAPWSFPWLAVNRAKSPSFDLYDEAGNKTTLATDYIVDDDPPVIQSAVSNATYVKSVLDDGTGSRDVIVDNTLPALKITKAPRIKSKLKKTTTVTSAAGGRNGVARVQLLVNGKLVATDSKAGYSFALNPKKYGKTFSVQLRAYDRAGNVRYTGKLTYYR